MNVVEFPRRPPTLDARLDVRVPAELADKLRAYCERENVPASVVVRHSVDQFLSMRFQPIDDLERALTNIVGTKEA